MLRNTVWYWKSDAIHHNVKLWKSIFVDKVPSRKTGIVIPYSVFERRKKLLTRFWRDASAVLATFKKYCKNQSDLRSRHIAITYANCNDKSRKWSRRKWVIWQYSGFGRPFLRSRCKNGHHAYTRASVLQNHWSVGQNVKGNYATGIGQSSFGWSKTNVFEKMTAFA